MSVDATSIDESPVGGSTRDADWWRQAVVYQIYPRSFADGNGDGIGDLVGIRSRIDYLAALGVDAVWLSPFYPSELADGGYDVADYRNVDPNIGTLEDFDDLVRSLHAAGIKLIVDIVPNHSSDKHVWFEAAIAAGRGSAERDRYIFRDGLGADGSQPPADWVSIFGGPAWTRVREPNGQMGQWYLHSFAREQPDWNWSNPEVREDFLTTLAFWGDRGVDGFRVDVAHQLAKHLPAELPSQQELSTPGLYPEGEHPVVDRDEVQEIYAEWRALFDTYDPPLAAVAEAWVPAHRRVKYAHSGSLGQAFNFDLLEATWDAQQFATIIEENLHLSGLSGASSTWVFSNHDVVRHATRYGLPDDRSRGKHWLLSGGSPPEDIPLGARRSRAVTLLSLALPGSAYLYQGEELGLLEVVDIPADARQDPTFFRSDGADVGRDGCRVPLPWSSSEISFGFGSGSAHLPQPSWFADYAVDIQHTAPESVLNFYRRALAVRVSLQGAEQLEWLDFGADVIAFSRPGGWISITNFGNRDVKAPEGDIVVDSYLGCHDGRNTGNWVKPDTTVWIQTPQAW
ncbi:MAG: glycoside hydrolase family 13 protein [Rhodococcus sp. (in: high G+C Gram-positive bacteria)]